MKLSNHGSIFIHLSSVAHFLDHGYSPIILSICKFCVYCKHYAIIRLFGIPFIVTFMTADCETTRNKCCGPLPQMVGQSYSSWYLCSWFDSPGGSRPDHFRAFTIMLRHIILSNTTLGDRPVAENSTLQHTAFQTERLPCLWRDSNPQSQ
jgi:uncharacterized protein YodC (DUF2158 family)